MKLDIVFCVVILSFLITLSESFSNEDEIDNENPLHRVKRRSRRPPIRDSHHHRSHHRIPPSFEDSSSSSSSEELADERTILISDDKLDSSSGGVKLRPRHHKNTIVHDGRNAGFAEEGDYNEEDEDDEEEAFKANWANCKLKCCHPDCLRNVPQCAGKELICSKIPFQLG